MADMIKFYKGLEASLPASGTNGALYITTDEGAIYLGTGTGMKRLGDFVQVANVAALPAKAHENCLYYCVAENILAKWNGTEWKQVNKQPTTEELKTLLGLKDLAYLSEVSEDNLSAALKEKVNAASDGNHSHNNKALLDTYTQTEADLADAVAKKHSHANADELAKIATGDVEKWNNKVDKVTGKSLVSDTEITKLAGVSEGANKVEASTTNGKIKIDGAETTVYTHPDKHTISEVDGLEIKLQKLTTNKLNEVKATDASILVTYEQTDAGSGDGTYEAISKGASVKVQISKDADNALALADDGLKVTIPAAAEYSIVKAADSGEYAAIYNLTKDGAVVGASINIPKDLVVKSGSVVGDEIVLVLNDEANTEIKIPVGSLIEYVTSGSATGDMVVVNVSDDHKVTATITDGTITLAKLTTEVQTAIGKAHDHSNKAVIDGITAQNITDWNDAVSKEHEHENKELLDTYTQTEADLADAVAKKHSHANATVLDGITAEKVTAWDNSEQNAKDYADGLLSWGSF